MHYTLKSKNWKKTLPHYSTKKTKKVVGTKLETAGMSLNGVRKVIFETEEEEKEKD